MIVRVLGSAAGGGVPQWNCACANCSAARAGSAPRRTESTLAISPKEARGKHWFLLNCSPDIGSQIEAFEPLHPARGRVTPIGDVLLTDANLDHIGGLAVLRQAKGMRLRVRSTAVVREIAAAQPSFAHFAAPPHLWQEAPIDETIPNIGDDDVIGDWLEVRTIAVPGTTPGYDGRRPLRGAVVAYEIADRGSEERLLFAPVFSAIDTALAVAIASASVAFLDGTFFTDDELETKESGAKRGRAMGHQPVGGSDGTLAQLQDTRARIVFTHLNNSNPMLDSRSEAHAAVLVSGAEIAYDGMQLTL
ncbi:MAG: MBL fold metallo-hydrolase [Candidatus Cybelea sp.]